MSGHLAPQLFVIWLVATVVFAFVLDLPTGWVVGLGLVVIVIGGPVLESLDRPRVEREAALRAAQERAREQEEEERQRREAEARGVQEQLKKQEEELKLLRERLGLSEDDSDGSLSK